MKNILVGVGVVFVSLILLKEFGPFVGLGIAFSLGLLIGERKL